ncbi:alkaline phosphatase [Caenimonas koreensis DSM 17982]|uniref:Alkaline phosphatase n=1 Tax=Caenimonas koreensis DSM 17982 TaxID=1121255 RepID=A0A844AVK8_9BURK|nr:alkaline phosphatase D family protein [Caenimonas koreensis]MRD46418.1 alkaline phosphatase [Caenimonas koreensis DSM 17982]
MDSDTPSRFARRSALRLIGAGGLALGGGMGGGLRAVLAQGQAPALVTPDKARPQMPYGVMSGDVTGNRAVVWSRADRSARMVVDLSTTQGMGDARRIIGPAALESSDFTAHLDVGDLAPGQTYFYRVQFQDLADPKIYSVPLIGRFRTPPIKARDLVFAFSGDEAGQGWGINEAWGGYRVYESMRKFNPDFFIHSGDQIYADGPLQPEVRLDDGSVWKNLVTPAKSKVAETLDEFRGNFAYNLLDENKRRFCAEVPMLVQWDDHEIRNNWFPDQQFGPQDTRYQERSASLLAARANRAMFEYNAMRPDPVDPERVYRAFRMGPLADVFMLDERSYRGPNTANRQGAGDRNADFLGPGQTRWLKQSLLASRATWKVIASDMPLSIVVRDLNADVPKGTFEAWANADDGPPSGRELEVADLLGFIKQHNINNVVWVTADVHYASATHYRPDNARFTNFKPFWEFVGGPLNAGTFGPGEIDRTFGPEVKFVGLPPGMKQNRPPSDGLQFFGIGRIDARSRSLTVSLHGGDGQTLFEVELPAMS